MPRKAVDDLPNLILGAEVLASVGKDPEKDRGFLLHWKNTDPTFPLPAGAFRAGQYWRTADIEAWAESAVMPYSRAALKKHLRNQASKWHLKSVNVSDSARDRQ